MLGLDYLHVDVFTEVPFSGNSLAVFPDAADLDADQALRITQELRHFESIFLVPTAEPARFVARVFDLFEELPFAGHPLIGAAAALQHKSGDRQPRTWRFALGEREVTVDITPTAQGFRATLDQGTPAVLGTTGRRAEVAAAFGLTPTDLARDLPLEVGSTGLAYLVVPVTPDALDRARVVSDLTPLLHSVRARFAVLFDPAGLEMRHWNNDGVVEDVATGSAAGVVAAYGLRHGVISPDRWATLRQGRFTGRPSRLEVRASGEPQDVTRIEVGGDVAIVGQGWLWARPAPAGRRGLAA